MEFFFCSSGPESTFVSNTTSFDYEMLPLGTTQGRTIIFQAAARAEMRVALMSGKEQLPDEMTGLPSYHLVLGGEENTNSWISKHMNGTVHQKFLMEDLGKEKSPDPHPHSFRIAQDSRRLKPKLLPPNFCGQTDSKPFGSAGITRNVTSYYCLNTFVSSALNTRL